MREVRLLRQVTVCFAFVALVACSEKNQKSTSPDTDAEFHQALSNKNSIVLDSGLRLTRRFPSITKLKDSFKIYYTIENHSDQTHLNIRVGERYHADIVRSLIDGPTLDYDRAIPGMRTREFYISQLDPGEVTHFDETYRSISVTDISMTTEFSAEYAYVRPGCCPAEIAETVEIPANPCQASPCQQHRKQGCSTCGRCQKSCEPKPPCQPPKKYKTVMRPNPCFKDVTFKTDRRLTGSMIQVQGYPGVLLTFVDVTDGLPVGSELEYVAEITNQGDVVLRDLDLVVQFPTSFKYIGITSTTAPSGYDSKFDSGTNSAHIFNFGSLNPKEKRRFVLKIQGTEPGDLRPSLTMTSPDLSSPVVETESTHFYREDDDQQSTSVEKK